MPLRTLDRMRMFRIRRFPWERRSLRVRAGSLSVVTWKTRRLACVFARNEWLSIPWWQAEKEKFAPSPLSREPLRPPPRAACAVRYSRSLPKIFPSTWPPPFPAPWLVRHLWRNCCPMLSVVTCSLPTKEVHPDRFDRFRRPYRYLRSPRDRRSR